MSLSIAAVISDRWERKWSITIVALVIAFCGLMYGLTFRVAAIVIFGFGVAMFIQTFAPLLYAYTGHRGNAMPLLPKWWYRDDHEHIVDAFRGAAEYCRLRGFDYFYATSDDLARWTGADDQVKVDAVVHANRELSPVFTGRNGVLYQVTKDKEKLATNERE